MPLHLILRRSIWDSTVAFSLSFQQMCYSVAPHLSVGTARNFVRGDWPRWWGSATSTEGANNRNEMLERKPRKPSHVLRKLEFLREILYSLLSGEFDILEWIVSCRSVSSDRYELVSLEKWGACGLCRRKMLGLILSLHLFMNEFLRISSPSFSKSSPILSCSKYREGRVSSSKLWVSWGGFSADGSSPIIFILGIQVSDDPTPVGPPRLEPCCPSLPVSDVFGEDKLLTK